MAKVIAEHYELRSQIGRGGLATTYVARDLRSGTDVALKVVHQHLSEDARFVALFRQQAQASARLTHANIARVLDYGRWHETYYLVEEVVHGQSLAQILAKRGKLAAIDGLTIGAAVAGALSAAHAQQTVHRDLRPGNILVDAAGAVKVTDFGLAQAAAQTGLTMTTMALGTAYYAPPEQIQGQTTTPAADVYSLGATLYEMLSGRRPFEGSNPLHVAMQHINEDPPDLATIAPELSEQTMQTISRMLRKNPRERFADGSAALRAITALPEYAPRHVFNASQTALATGSSRRGGNRLVGVLFGLLVLALVAGTGGALATAGSQYLRSARLPDLSRLGGLPSANPVTRTPDVAVPSLVGSSLSQATDRLAQNGLSLAAVESRESSEGDRGRVLDQSPAAGNHVPAGTRVRLTLGSGPAAPMPSSSPQGTPRRPSRPDPTNTPANTPARSAFPTSEPKSPTPTPRPPSTATPSDSSPTAVPGGQPQTGGDQPTVSPKPSTGGATQAQGTVNAGTN